MKSTTFAKDPMAARDKAAASHDHRKALIDKARSQNAARDDVDRDPDIMDEDFNHAARGATS